MNSLDIKPNEFIGMAVIGFIFMMIFAFVFYIIPKIIELLGFKL